MPSLAITGTLGSGKSLLLKELTDALTRRGFETLAFSSDEENRHLLREDQEVRENLISSLGDGCLDKEGIPDRNRIRDLVSKSKAARESLERIMHPRLERIWRPTAARYRKLKSSFFIAEIPLLYEKGLAEAFDTVLVIGCSDAIRKSRLVFFRSITEKQADHWLSIQQSQERKISLADYLIWNDGSVDSLRRQLSPFLRSLCTP